MYKPVAVFDAGIGSYAIVAEIQRQLPKQDIIYFADRASFPYGSKSRDELLGVMGKTIAFLERENPSAIVVASNAPSIMVLENIRQLTPVPLFGVFPPLQEALAVSKTGRIGIMGVQSLIESPALELFVKRCAARPESVALINASPMVELVENGEFLFSPEETQAAISIFVEDIFRRDPLIDVLTLSSTHLPWLRHFFEAARPACLFLGPAQEIVSQLGEGTTGSGQIRALVTQDGNYDVDAFRQMLSRIGVHLPLEVVDQL